MEQGIGVPALINDAVVVGLFLLGGLPRLGPTPSHDGASWLGFDEEGEHSALLWEVVGHGVEHGAELGVVDVDDAEDLGRNLGTQPTKEATEVSMGG